MEAFSQIKLVSDYVGEYTGKFIEVIRYLPKDLGTHGPADHP